MKNKKLKLIIIIAAVLVVVAGGVTAIIGYNAGWFGNSDELVKKEILDETGTYVVRDEYYNKDGELEYQVVKTYADDEKTKIRTETYLNSEKKVTKIVGYGDDGTVAGVDEYSDNKQVSRKEYLNGELSSRFEYEYSDSGLILCTTEYDVNDEIIRTIKREYNDKDMITLFLETGKSGNQIAKTVYEYNDIDKESRVTFYDGEGITGHVEYEYDAEGNRIKMSEYVKGVLSNYRTYTYDENGVAQETYHKADEK